MALTNLARLWPSSIPAAIVTAGTAQRLDLLLHLRLVTPLARGNVLNGVATDDAGAASDKELIVQRVTVHAQIVEQRRVLIELEVAQASARVPAMTGPAAIIHQRMADHRASHLIDIKALQRRPDPHTVFDVEIASAIGIVLAKSVCRGPGSCESGRLMLHHRAVWRGIIVPFSTVKCAVPVIAPDDPTVGFHPQRYVVLGAGDAVVMPQDWFATRRIVPLNHR